MSTVLQFWEPDGPNGEALIKEYRVHVMQAMIDAAMIRPSRCCLVTLHDTRGNRDVELWIKPGYRSGTCTGQRGTLNVLKDHI